MSENEQNTFYISNKERTRKRKKVWSKEDIIKKGKAKGTETRYLKYF